MKKIILTILIIILSVPVSFSREFPNSPEERIKFLLRLFGELPADHAAVSRVRKVFERVRAAADKRAGREPKLLIIRDADEPWAICLRDGTIVLTQKGMEICYRNVDKVTGDSRVAFVLGHEMAHLADGDFWDWEAFQTVTHFGKGKEAVEELLRLLKKSDDPKDQERGAEERMRKELRADGYGLVYAAMAGYDPKAVTDRNGKNFLKEWADQITGKAAYGKNHPHPDLRAEFLVSEMQSVREFLDFFHIGVRLYQVGNYADAIGFLEAFKMVFPSREVFSNIGLCHYQLALKALAEYDRPRVYRWKLSVIADAETRAGLFRGSEEIFQKEMQKAIRCFRKACEKDPFYIPARVNLSAAYIMTEQHDEALTPLKEALELRKDHPGVLNNYAVARYESQSFLGEDYSEQTVSKLKDVIAKHPGFPDPWYNLGRIRHDQKKQAPARVAWSEYLRLEPSGDCAVAVKKRLGQIHSQAAVTEKFSEPPFVRPNTSYKDVKNRLRGMNKRSPRVGNMSCSYFSGKDISILIMGGQVKLVESPVKTKMRLSDMNLGSPGRILPHCSGAEIFVYQRFALEVRDGVAEKVVHF